MATLRLSLAARLLSSCGARAPHCRGVSCCRARALDHPGSIAEAHGLSFPVACGLSPDQGLNLYPLQWQADSQPPEHHRSSSRGPVTAAAQC